MRRGTQIALIGLVLAAASLAGSASACPGRFAEKYLFWQGLPELASGEVAIEVDIRSAMKRPRAYDADLNTDYRVARVIAGEFDGEIIKVKVQATSCSREIGGGTPDATVKIDRLILIGRLEKGPGDVVRLIPRYMAANEAQQFGLRAAEREQPSTFARLFRHRP